MRIETHPDYQLGKNWMKKIDAKKKKGGRPENFFQAFEHFRSAAYSGHGPSQVMISRMYMYGEGVPCSILHAYAWANVACAIGNLKEKDTLNGNGTEDREFMKQADEIRSKIRNELATYEPQSTFGANVTAAFSKAHELSIEIWDRIRTN